MKFLEYFEFTYLKDYKIEYWNYYENIDHITNNASESYNNYLKKLFPKKPSFYLLIYTLKKEEFLSCGDYDRRNRGVWEKKPKKIGRTDEINAIINYYKKMEIFYKKKKVKKKILLNYG